MRPSTRCCWIMAGAVLCVGLMALTPRTQAVPGGWSRYDDRGPAPVAVTAADHGGPAAPPWRCPSSYTWTVGHTVGARSCYAVQDDRVLVKGEIIAAPGMVTDVLVTLRDADSQRTVAGPFVCQALAFDRSTQMHTCGGFAVSPERGRQYVVVEQWRYRKLDRTPRGSGRSAVFPW